MRKTYLSPNDYQRDIWRLAAKVRASGWKPDFLVGLWRGGAPVAVAVHEFLKVTGWEVEHLPLKCRSYAALGCVGDKVTFTFGDSVFALFHPRDRVLFVDDVFDTGTTAAAVFERAASANIEAKLACVYWKREMNRTARTPDFVARELGGDWIVFPHEIEGLESDEVREKDPVLASLIDGVED